MTPRDEYIETMRSFHILCGVPRSTDEEYGKDFDDIKKKDRARELESAKTHLTIARLASQTARGLR
jgi:hypothetical protein